MKKAIGSVLLCLFLVFSYGAEAAPEKQYTLSTKTGTVLQAENDRGITPQTAPARHPLLPGESPTTGLPWEGEYRPMLVHLGNNQGTVKGNGGTVQAPGIGKSAPWGVQYADIAYESLLVRMGQTRLTFLFSDSFVKGHPEAGVGPVRSTRVGSLLLREEWQAGLVFSGGPTHTLGWSELLRQTSPDKQGVLFSLLAEGNRDLKYRVQGVKAPDNYNADITGFRKLVPEAYVSQPRPFLFADESPYARDYEPAHTIHLDWGAKETATHFQYDEGSGTYQRFCGAGMKEKRWAPYQSFASVDNRSEESMVPLSFANLIVQRVEYQYENDSKLLPIAQSVGKGNADLFIGGRYIPGYWVRGSLQDPTVFYDDKGHEIQLLRGKTFIAQFPPEDACIFQGAEE